MTDKEYKQSQENMPQKIKQENLNKLKDALSLLDEEKLLRLQNIIEETGNNVLRQEFAQHFKQLIDFLKKIRAENEELVKLLKEEYGTKKNELTQDNDKQLTELKERIDNLTDNLIATIKEKLATLKDDKDADEDRVSIVASERAIEAVTPLIPTTKGIKKQLLTMGKTLRKALNKKLKVSDIKDLQKELDELKKLRSQTVMAGGGSSGGGRIMKVYDLSDSLNGVLKTFSLPAFWRVISVHSSSFPNAFRPTTDYTTDASAMTITFTSEINAATTLDTNQTIIVTYSE